jgi:glucose 1-dehydrogenase
MRLNGKAAIVTGGARGIGLAVAKRYVAEGARVVIADVDAESGAAAAAALGESCRFVATDVGDATAVERLVAEAVSAFETIDVLVNNPASSMRPIFSISRQPILTGCCA